jgi:molybdopterin-containing oxidoreductase family iron-sulfur binding subunit
MEGRPLVRESTVAELLSAKKEEGRPSALGVFEEKPEHFSLWKEHTYDQGHQWGMTIDLNACIGCNACMTACQSENNVPVVGKIRLRNSVRCTGSVDRHFPGEPSGSRRSSSSPFPACLRDACEQVCPVAATVHDGEGLNVMVYNRCIGTTTARTTVPGFALQFFNFTRTPDILKLAMNPDVTVRARGVMEVHVPEDQSDEDRCEAAGRELRDGDVKTACQQACPASAIEFEIFGTRRAGSRGEGRPAQLRALTK